MHRTVYVQAITHRGRISKICAPQHQTERLGAIFALMRVPPASVVVGGCGVTVGVRLRLVRIVEMIENKLNDIVKTEATITLHPLQSMIP